ncbi:MAG: sulfite exporter TauE/SafE family protein [Armatimonadota bacterium]
MPELSVIVILVFVIFLARWLESIMGFGGTVLSLPILAILIPDMHITGVLVPVLALGNIVCCIGIVYVGRHEIVWREYGIIMLYMGIGVPAGFWAAGVAPEVILRLVLGLFVFTVAVANLIQMAINDGHGDDGDVPLFERICLRTLVIGAGVIHGMFTTGGPPLVIYAARALKSKGLFRVTLAMVWLTLNVIIVSGWYLDGRIQEVAWPLAGITIPFIIIAVFIGDHFHHRMPEQLFRKAAYVLLLISGGSLIYKALPDVLAMYA